MDSTKCTKCGGKLSPVIGLPSERRVVCYGCGMQYSCESWCEEVHGDEVALQNTGLQRDAHSC